MTRDIFEMEPMPSIWENRVESDRKDSGIQAVRPRIGMGGEPDYMAEGRRRDGEDPRMADDEPGRGE